MSKPVAHLMHWGSDKTWCGLRAPLFNSKVLWFGYSPRCSACVSAKKSR